MRKLVDSLFFPCRTTFYFAEMCMEADVEENMVKEGAGVIDNFYSFLGNFGKLLQTCRDKILRDEEINRVEIAYTEFENVITEDLSRSRYVVLTSFNIIIIEFSNDTINATRIKRSNNYFIVDKEYRYRESNTRFSLGYMAAALTISLANGETVKFYRPEDTLVEDQKNFEKFVNLIE